MRIGTFLLGGLAGAATVIYMNRKSKSMMTSAFKSSSESMGKAMDKAKDSFSSKSFKPSTDSSSANMWNAGAGSKDSVSQVQKIINEEPSLKAAVNEILKENKANESRIQ